MGFFSDVGDITTDAWKGLTGETAADASAQGAETTAAAQQASLDYYRDVNALPQAQRTGAIGQYGALSGFDAQGNYTGDFSAQQDLIGAAQQSPFYQAGMDQGTESLARSLSATGGLRGGGGAADIAGYESNLLNTAYNQQVGQLGNLMQIPDTSGQTAQMIAAPGTTLGQGQVAAGQATTDAWGNIVSGGSQAAMMSDQRMKENINKISGTSHPDINLYEWDWRKESGKEGYEAGFIAQEVEKVWPEFVVTGEDGIKRIYKDKIEERLNG